MLEKWRAFIHESILEHGLGYADINSYTCVVIDNGIPTGVFKFNEDDTSYTIDTSVGTETFILKERVN